MAPSLPGPAKRIGLAEDNVWAWVDEASLACKGPPLIKMGSGFLEFNPPDFLIRAHQEALMDIDINQYGPLYGRTNLRQAVAKEYSPLFGRKIDEMNEISISSGASEGMLSILMGYVEPGDEVIVMEPCFNLYLYLIQWVGGVPRTVSIRPPSLGHNTSAHDWTLDMEELEAAITPKTKFLILNTPHNPLGKVFSETELIQIGNICLKHNVYILSDEVYERIAYTTTFPRLATLDPAFANITFTVFSVGKAFNATGWRLGFVIGPAASMPPVQISHIFQTYVTAGPPQEAAAKGYGLARQVGFWTSNVTNMKSKVDSFCEVLLEIGLPFVKPDAAFFLWVDVTTIEVPAYYQSMEHVAGKPHDYQVCFFLMHKFGVISIPGSGFYLKQSQPYAHTHLRFTVCKTERELEEVKARLRGLTEFVRK